jgi:hypothetical protein
MIIRRDGKGFREKEAFAGCEAVHSAIKFGGAKPQSLCRSYV